MNISNEITHSFVVLMSCLTMLVQHACAERYGDTIRCKSRIRGLPRGPVRVYREGVLRIGLDGKGNVLVNPAACTQINNVFTIIGIQFKILW